MSLQVFSPLNDFAFVAKLTRTTAPTGAAVPITSGTVTAFLSAGDNSAEATAFDGDWEVEGTYLTSHEDGDGHWLFEIDAAKITAEKYDAMVEAATEGDGKLYLIIVVDGGLRAFSPVKFARTRKAVVT